MSEHTLSGDDVRLITLWANDAPTSKTPLRQTQAMVRALLRVVPQWQPIATAPRDGTRIILFRKGRVVMGQYCDDRYNARPRPYWKHDYPHTFGVRDARDVPPTHWQPLPEPPQVGE